MHLPMLSGPDLAALGAVVGSAAIWLTVARRLARGQAIVPYEGRSPVPWRGRDVAFVFAICLLPALAGLWYSWAASAPKLAPPVKAGEVDAAHPVLVLLRSNPRPLTLLFCVFAVVVVAPVVEEVLFRLILQGWMERVDRLIRRRMGFWRPLRGFWPVAITSLLFASLHFRTAQPPMKPHEIVEALAINAGWQILTLAIAAAWLRVQCGASWADLGIVPAKLPGDLRLGLLAFVAVAAPIYVLQAGLQTVLKGIAPDPITLTLFALVLGFLYYRTHRLVPSIVLHMALNATSLALAWSAIG